MNAQTSASLRRIKQLTDAEAHSLGITVQRILCFGSQARKDARQDGGWDLLVITDHAIERTVRLDLGRALAAQLARERLPSDILVMSADQFESRKQDVGHIAYYADKESAVLQFFREVHEL
ncbi:MAG: nucleotidyltransferase domain-containing protein [Anaerolineae bacterium]|nr:nucleotidyltransferase domain-containing protein [Anaerolineae bacterium]